MVAVNTSFFSEMLQSIADRSRAFLRERREGRRERSEGLIELCEDLLSGRGEASGVALADEILADYAALKTGPRVAFFEALARVFGYDSERIDAAIAAWTRAPSAEAAAELNRASEPRRLELFRRLNLAPGGTAALVRMREQLLDAMGHRDDLAVVDNDFVHLFSSWFNRGFLVLRRIDWQTPALILEKIIRYEAVHQIRDWNDLRRRIDLPDRRCYAFFHPALVDEPLIFVEVALTREIPGAIAPILADKREVVDPARASTAVFYSITSCQRGLAGVSFGHFLIKQVAEEISRAMSQIGAFVTLSPAPNFAAWLARERNSPASIALTDADRQALAALDNPDWWRDPAVAAAVREPLLSAAAWYFLRGRNARNQPVDAVARFHLGNGARLERLDWLGDTSERALAQSHGLMVNYLYELDQIERNHEAYAQQQTVVAASAVSRLVHAPVREIVPVSG
ncbi:MAG: malonyl-CoA decarboxylase [Hyphomicrobiales bacterium]|nr:malonyl-CoA decarboxylase family protein [Hyphomicrobiales bacterium]MDE1972144.1 malonyl-CoA decarboxylase [Hyphomicrobiales bacterium]MDE2286298.1 malonyl-CoA decarboxylase [Hyphomicrobiales bacterium]